MMVKDGGAPGARCRGDSPGAAPEKAVKAMTGAGITPSMLEILDRTTVKAVDDMTKNGCRRRHSRAAAHSA
ncbi:hypothetical protein [Rhodococcus sp. IEGM 1307]|uniref:hypothetical protein n=1 Tax=Rhodococcus sp. IEGM 1307 TaxID=3047091 RepID=UPI0024B73D35|nr:hypothetical protein [Rhodococcus sp. IEGM 1307]MDI9974305.1 hypothetical protein [Rhodococcus sp. IEGM 1307]